MGIGWFNKMANKAAQMISFKLLGKRLLVINCHLDAHEEERESRNN